MKKFTLMLALLVLLIPTLINAQSIPNPTGIAGSFTSTVSIENEHIISINRLGTDNRTYSAQFIYKFTVSDTCRIVLSHASLDSKFKSDDLAGAGADDYAVTYIPLEAGIEYSIDCNATDLKIYRAGASVTLTYSGVVEYE